MKQLGTTAVASAAAAAAAAAAGALFSYGFPSVLLRFLAVSVALHGQPRAAAACGPRWFSYVFSTFWEQNCTLVGVLGT